jgi:APA family basic amino acid/polyamine antiporter
MNADTARPLRKILGLGFGLAIGFGNMVGVGILRLPGTVAAAVGDRSLVMACWLIGGLYTLMAAVSVTELATMFPEAGGFRVYARRAFGEAAGFVVGWVDWLAGVATIAYAAVTVGDFLGGLWPALAAHETAIGLAVVVVFTAVHRAGLRAGSSLTSFISAAIGVLLTVVVARCFLAPTAATSPAATALPVPGPSAASHPLMSMAMLLAAVPAMRSILTAYDGWYAAIYMAEENTDAARTLPRSIIGGALLVVALYLLINAALLRVLPIPTLAASALPAAAAAQLVLPRGGMELVTIISTLTVLSLTNINSLTAPRVLFALARDGWIPGTVAAVSRGGTPTVALAATMLAAAAMILTGSFNQIIALFAVLILLYYVSAFLAVFVLRYRMPGAPRPYRALGYPVTTSVALLGSVAFLVAALIEDRRAALLALGFIAACVPAYAWAARARRARLPSLRRPAAAGAHASAEPRLATARFRPVRGGRPRR